MVHWSGVMEMDKATLRKQITDWRKSLDSETIMENSLTISQRLIALPVYQKASTLMVYSAFGAEVDLRLCIEHARASGKTLLFPKVYREEKRLQPYMISSDEELTPGTWGILEPNEIARRWQGEPPLDLVIMPGLAFDRKGNRLGYGGGYYDRWLETLQGQTSLPALVAVAFEGQVVEAVPHGVYDKQE